MPVFVDPKTGERYDSVPDDESERAQKEFGLVTPEIYQAQQESPLKAAARAGSAAALAPLEAAGHALQGIGLSTDPNDPSLSPEARAYYERQGKASGEFFTKAALAKEAQPLAGLAGEALPMGIYGALSGGVGSGLVGGAPLVGATAGLLSESAVQGVSQEAVDAITQKRDFSGKAALMNGGINLALGGLGLGVGHYVGGLLGGEARAAGEALEGAPTRRNWVAEIDPGEVPDAIGGGRRARSAGAAGASNSPYSGAAAEAAPVNLQGRSLEDLGALPIDDAADRARVDALKQNEYFANTGKVASNDGSGGITLVDDAGDVKLRDGRHRLTAAQELGRDTVYGKYVDGKTGKVIYEGEIPLKAPANDVEPFADDVYDAAAKSFDDAPDTKLSERQARFLSDPNTAKNLTDLGAMNVADNLDTVRTVLRDDASLAAKNEDWHRMAAEWTPEEQAAKKAWVEKDLTEAVEGLSSHIDDTRTAASDLRAGRQGPRPGGAAAIEAGGFDASIQKTLRTGLDKIRRAEGAEQVIAIDGLKREIGGTVRDLGRSRALDEATKAERIDKLTELYTHLQEGLQREDLFGQMGSLQKATNEATTRLIEPFSRIEAKFSERLGDTWGKTGQQAINRETKASAVASMLRSSPVERREFIRALDDGLAAADDLIAAREAHGITRLEDLTAAKRGLQEIRNEFKFSAVLQAAERRAGEVTPGLGQMAAEAAMDFAASKVPLVGGAAAKQGKGFLRGLANAAEMPAKGTPLGDVLAARLKAYAKNPDLADAGVSRTLPRWLQESLKGHGGQVAGVAALAGGAAILGTPGTAGAAEMLPEQRAARDGLDAQLRTLPPEQQQAHLRTAEAFARIQQKTESRVKGSVTDLFALAKDPNAKPRYQSPQSREIDRRSQELDVPRHLARFMGKTDDPVDVWRDKSALINQVMADPSKLASTMAQNLGDLPRQQPEMFASMVGQTMATVQYLHDKMPGVAGRSALDPHGYPPTFEEISEWAGHWVGAIHPLDSLDDLASNELVPEQIEAVQSLWPEGYQMFQTSAMAQIHSLSQKRGVIPLEALEQIDSALDLDGAGEPILSSAFAGLLKQATAKDAEKLQAQASKPQAPMVSQSPSRLASSSLASLHAE